MTNKEIYHQHCDTDETISMFHQPWWLDAVCGPEAWDVVISQDQDGRLQGALAYFHQQRYGMKLLRQPILTPYLGIIFQYPLRQSKLSRQYAFERKVVADLVQQLPAYAYFNQHFHPEYSNGQILHWEGLQQATYYSSKIDLSQSLETIYNDFEGSVRTEIRKAEDRLRFETSEDISTIYQLNQKSFAAQSKAMPFDLPLLQTLDKAIAQRSKRKILVALDQQDQVHACVYLLQEHGTLYSLMIGSDPDLRSSGAVSYLIWRLIKEHHKDYHSLDFCGSMIERFQRVFRSFGAVQLPYLRVYQKRGLFRFINAFTQLGE